MNDMDLDVARSEPPRQPEAVSAGLERNRDPFDLVPGLFRFHSPSIQQLQQRVLIGI
jgi:hypothetical protein